MISTISHTYSPELEDFGWIQFLVETQCLAIKVEVPLLTIATLAPPVV